MSWNDVPEYTPFAAWPSGKYPVMLKTYELKTTKPEKGSKLMFQATFECTENDHPALQAYVGRSINDWFVVGNDDDPGVEDSDTLNSGNNKGVQKLKALAKAANVTPDDPEAEITMDVLNEVLDNIIGTDLIAIVKSKGKGTDAQHNINGYVAMGEVQIGLETNDKSNMKSTGMASKPNTMGPKSLQGAIKDAKAAKGKTKLTVVEDIEIMDEEVPSAPKTAKKGKAAESAKAHVKCPLCKELFPYDKLSAHVEECPAGKDDTSYDDDE